MLNLRETNVISSHLPDLINQYISVRAQRLVLDKEAATLKESEEELKKTIISKFREGDIQAMGADNGLVKMTTLDEPKCTDWSATYEHIRETGSFELLHRRLANLAVRERWEAGEEIPGVIHTTLYKLSVSDVKS
jgi:hypothetical protein